MSYVDGFVLPVPKKNLKAYRTMAQKAGKIWCEYGALDYKECVGDDMNVKMGLPFPRAFRSKANEAIVFAYIVYKSKAHRNAVNKKILKDPRLYSLCDPNNMPFDLKRMCYGGFKTIVNVQKPTQKKVSKKPNPKSRQ